MNREPDELNLALRLVLLPRDANIYGTIFGGTILSAIDQAGFIESRKHGQHRWVTASVDRVDFHAPVHVGDTISLLTRTKRLGRTSATVHILVEADRYLTRDVVKVTEATLTMVAVNSAGRPIPHAEPPSVGPAAFEASEDDA